MILMEIVAVPFVVESHGLKRTAPPYVSEQAGKLALEAANYLAFVQLASIRLWLRVNESAS
jgi:hypothetical protein